MEEFAIYIDDSGSPKPNIKDSTPHFAMGGVIVNRSNQSKIENLVEGFKERWSIPTGTPLHGSSIRSKKKDFAFLSKLPETKQACFHADLSETITSCPIVINACVISREGYCSRYQERYGPETWEMMKTAFVILLERTVKFVMRHNGKVMVYYEKIGKKEDKKLEGYFHDLQNGGHPFDPNKAKRYQPLPVSEMEKRLSGIEGKSKNTPAMQIADLCLYPVANGKSQHRNRALLAMHDKKVIIDDLLEPESIEIEGIKYFCFD